MVEIDAEHDWRDVIAEKTAIVKYGFEVVNGMETDFRIDIEKAPREVTEIYEGKESKKWAFDIELIECRVRDKLDMQILLRDKPEKHARVIAKEPGFETLKLTRKQTNDFVMFLLNYEDVITVRMWRTGATVKTQYHFEIVE